jgi:hypothetical protein
MRITLPIGLRKYWSVVIKTSTHMDIPHIWYASNNHKLYKLIYRSLKELIEVSFHIVLFSLFFIILSIFGKLRWSTLLLQTVDLRKQTANIEANLLGLHSTKTTLWSHKRSSQIILTHSFHSTEACCLNINYVVVSNNNNSNTTKQ